MPLLTTTIITITHRDHEGSQAQLIRAPSLPTALLPHHLQCEEPLLAPRRPSPNIPPLRPEHFPVPAARVAAAAVAAASSSRPSAGPSRRRRALKWAWAGVPASSCSEGGRGLRRWGCLMRWRRAAGGSLSQMLAAGLDGRGGCAGRRR